MKSGRKAKPGPRYPSGDRIESIRDSGYHPAAVKRLLDDAVMHAADPRLGTPIGRLCLEGKLSAMQFAAGMRWDELSARYLIAIDASKPSPQSPKLGNGSYGHDPDPDSEKGRRIAKSSLADIEAYDKAHKALISAGLLAECAVRRICEGKGSSTVGHADLLHLKRGLGALARVFWRKPVRVRE